MNITSVSSRDLFQILTGYKFHDVKPEESIENAPEKNVNTSTFTSVVYSEHGEYFSNHWDECHTHVSTTNYNNLVDYFSDMGRRIDDAYAEGKFTEEEYNELNIGFQEYIKNETQNWDKTRALYKYDREQWAALKRERRSVGPNTDIRIKTPDELKSAKEAKLIAIETVLNRVGFRTDITKLLETIDKYRNDTSIDLNSKKLDPVTGEEISLDDIELPFYRRV